MLRVVSPGELETWHCMAVELLVYIPDEDYPRCFECLRPVREYCKLDNCGRWAYLVWSLMVAHESAEEPSEDLPTAASSAEPGVGAPAAYWLGISIFNCKTSCARRLDCLA